MAKHQDRFIVIEVTNGREFAAHELCEKELKQEVYTPFRIEMEHPSRKEKKAGAASQPYAQAIYERLIFVRSGAFYGRCGELLLTEMPKIAHLIKTTAYMRKFYTCRGAVLSLTERDVDNWRRNLVLYRDERDAKGRKPNAGIKVRGYDKARDGRLNKHRIYGQPNIPMPVFTEGDVVRFYEGSFAGISMEVSDVSDISVDLKAILLGKEHILDDIDPYLLQKVS